MSAFECLCMASESAPSAIAMQICRGLCQSLTRVGSPESVRVFTMSSELVAVHNMLSDPNLKESVTRYHKCHINSRCGEVMILIHS